MIFPKVQNLSIQGSRHVTNDDYSLANPEQGIYVLCDGVSEGGKGKYASEFITKQLQEKLVAANQYVKQHGAQLLGVKRLQKLQELLLNAFTDAQKNLMTLAQGNANFKNANTTCLALWMDGRFGILAHIGDSRAYLVRGGKIYQLTKDHTGLDELMRMGFTREEAEKNPMSRALSRAFGSRYAQPDLLKIEFQPNDSLILCSDGVYGATQEQGFAQLVQALGSSKPLQPMLEQCARVGGDDATLIELHFPAELLQASPIQAADRIKLVQLTPLSKYLDYVQRSHVAAVCEIEEYKANSLVVQEGTEGECLYIVAKGTLDIVVKGQSLTYKRPGEFIGEVALIRRSRRTASVIAKEDTILLSLSRTDLEEVFKKDPHLERSFYKGMLEMVIDRMVEQGNEIVQLKSM